MSTTDTSVAFQQACSGTRPESDQEETQPTRSMDLHLRENTKKLSLKF